MKYDEKGLIPAVVQNSATKEVLMVAYMNEDTFNKTVETKRATFWSRSRGELWRKGETSGCIQHVVRITADCDRDALVVEVIKDGPACHLGTDSCFTALLYDEGTDDFSLSRLYELLKERNRLRPSGSYTTYLFEKGREKILKKVGEETTEVVVAAMKGSREETVFEISDLAYHVLVLMNEMGITPEDILKELASRHVIDKKVKQETMK